MGYKSNIEDLFLPSYIILHISQIKLSLNIITRGSLIATNFANSIKENYIENYEEGSENSRSKLVRYQRDW